MNTLTEKQSNLRSRYVTVRTAPDIEIPWEGLWKQCRHLTFGEVRRVKKAAEAAAMMEIETIARELLEQSKQ